MPDPVGRLRPRIWPDERQAQQSSVDSSKGQRRSGQSQADRQGRRRGSGQHRERGDERNGVPGKAHLTERQDQKEHPGENKHRTQSVVAATDSQIYCHRRQRQQGPAEPRQERMQNVIQPAGPCLQEHQTVARAGMLHLEQEILQKIPGVQDHSRTSQQKSSCRRGARQGGLSPASAWRFHQSHCERSHQDRPGGVLRGGGQAGQKSSRHGPAGNAHQERRCHPQSGRHVHRHELRMLHVQGRHRYEQRRYSPACRSGQLASRRQHSATVTTPIAAVTRRQTSTANP